MIRHEDKPYRPCVGVMVLNREGHAFIGRRTNGPEHVDAAHVWQMPQGGIDPDEEPWLAAQRELYEETSIRSIKLLGEAQDWLTYDLPSRVAGEAWKGRYRGQKQKWFAVRFLGADHEINVLAPGGGAHKPEFADWRWEPIDNLPRLIIPFKRKVYEQVVREFTKFAQP
jgi:putative (di)nucleoside polyphosphate hydrolase